MAMITAAHALDVALDRLKEADERERQLRALIREQQQFADAALSELHLALESQNCHPGNRDSGYPGPTQRPDADSKVGPGSSIAARLAVRDDRG